MIKLLFTLSLFSAYALGAPAGTKFLREASGDLQSLTQAKITYVKEKSAAVAEAAVAVANATMEYSGPVVDAVGLAAKNAASSAVDAGSAAIEYVRSIDPIEVLNKTEDSLKELFDLNKTEGAAGVIHNVFDAKRTVVAAKKDALNAKGKLLGEVAEAATDALEVAAAKISSALAAASQAVSEAAAAINSESTRAGFKRAGEAVSEAGSTVKASLKNATVAIHVAAKDFDSRKLMENKHNVIGSLLTTTADRAEKFADNIGLFHAIDSVVQGIAAIPGKVGEVVETIPDKLGAVVDTVLANEKTIVEEKEESVEK